MLCCNSCRGTRRLHAASPDAGEETTVEFEIPGKAFDVVRPDGTSRFEPGTLPLRCESRAVSVDARTNLLEAVLSSRFKFR